MLRASPKVKPALQILLTRGQQRGVHPLLSRAPLGSGLGAGPRGKAKGPLRSGKGVERERKREREIKKERERERMRD